MIKLYRMLLLFFVSGSVSANDIKDKRLMSQITVIDKHVDFIFPQ